MARNFEIQADAQGNREVFISAEKMHYSKDIVIEIRDVEGIKTAWFSQSQFSFLLDKLNALRVR